MARIRILVVDDELSIVKFLRANLEANGFTVVAATDGAEALQKIEMEPPDMVLLDITMPKMDGFEVCRHIRQWSQIPIIMISARADDSDKVKCLNLGADDYITKPFSATELIARVRAVLRRYQAIQIIPAQPHFERGALNINFASRQVTLAGAEVRLTPTEFNLLQELVLNRGKALTHTHLLNKVWGPEYLNEREYLHVFVGRLRAKLDSDEATPKHIITLPGVGYQFSDSD